MVGRILDHFRVQLTNRERSSILLLTVLPLLIGEQEEEGEGGKNERDGISDAWAFHGAFLVSGGPVRCVCGSACGNDGRFQKNVPNSPRKSYLDFNSENTFSVFELMKAERY